MKRDDLNEIMTVFRKDLIEVLRDYRTLIVMILMPVVIYPALLVLPSKIAHSIEKDMKTKIYSICLVGDAGLAERFFRQTKTLSIVKVLNQGDPEKLLAAKIADIVVSFPEQFGNSVQTEFKSHPTVTIYYDARRDQNLLALTEVRGVLAELRSFCLQSRFTALGINSPQKYAIDFSELKVTRDQSLASEPVRNLLPFLLFTMLTVSIIYPALDVITGERERNTLPLLLMSPSNRHNIMYGKFLTVLTMGMSAMIIGLFSIYLFVQLGSAGRTSDLLILKFPLPALLMCMFVAIPLVVTLSSLSILLASWCKTFQQGQGYFVPFLFVAMGATSVCSLPELKLSSGIALIPIVNIALSLKEVLSGHIDVIWLSVAFIISIAFALYVTYLASHILDSERLLYGVADSRMRRRLQGDFLPEVGILAFATFLLMFYVGQSLQMWDLIVGSLATQVIVILLPALYLIRHLKLPMLKTLSLIMPKPRFVLAAILIAPLCILISMLVYKLQSTIVPAPEAFTTMFTRLILDNDKPLWLCLLGIAIAPGICEELLFRGAILGLVRTKFKPVMACLTVGVLFGLFHMSLFRIGPTAVLGVVLTALTLLTGSIVPSMIVHIINNSAAVIMAKQGCEEMVIQYWYIPVASGAVGLFLLVWKNPFLKFDRNVDR